MSTKQSRPASDNRGNESSCLWIWSERNNWNRKNLCWYYQRSKTKYFRFQNLQVRKLTNRSSFDSNFISDQIGSWLEIKSVPKVMWLTSGMEEFQTPAVETLVEDLWPGGLMGTLSSLVWSGKVSIRKSVKYVTIFFVLINFLYLSIFLVN